MNLWHYTCAHSRAILGDEGVLLPTSELAPERAAEIEWPGRRVWLTDLATAQARALGLTSHTISCDRTEHRYRVVATKGLMPYWQAARELSREFREELEGFGARPIHWWVADSATVIWDPA